MISKDYRQNKTQVLALYDEYVQVCQNAEIKVDESISSQAKKIKDEEFNLMILGEAKSGKSTFINAYLGKEVLPMDVMQCTSAIIKIRKGDKFELMAKTAAGGRSIVKGDEKICEFLKSHAAISDRYRSIPITTINDELLIKHHGKKIPNEIMESFLEEGMAKGNIYKKSPEEYSKLVREYVAENADNWEKIITEMEITYPLSDEMRGITIIDSPGVGARGNVGRIAEEYIKNADALIFVKTSYGQPAESDAFGDFLKNTCTDRQKEFLFLVFTGTTTQTGADLAKFKEQAVDVYKNDIEEERILFVDSKIRLFQNKCQKLETAEKIDKYFDELVKANNDFSPASNCWLRAKDDVTQFNKKMDELSNFNSVPSALEKFARVANYLRLIKFLEALEAKYNHYKSLYTDALKVAEDTVDNPSALADRISQKKNEIAETYVKMTDGIEEIFKKYTDNINGKGFIMEAVKKKRKKYEGEVEDFYNLSEDQITESTFSAMKKMTLDAIEDTKKFRIEMATNIIKDFNQKLIQYTDDPSKIPAEAYTPNFTESDFDNIDCEAKKTTSGYNEIEQGLTFKSVERVPYHYLKKHVKLVANSINERLETEIMPTMINNIVNYLFKCRDVYTEKLGEHKKELEAEYQKLQENKDSNEQRCANVKSLKDKVSIVAGELTKITILEGDLRNYVGEQR